MRSSGRGTFRLFLAFLCTGWYDERMKKRVAYYVSRKNPLIWLAALVMLASAALRIANVCGKGADARIVLNDFITASENAAPFMQKLFRSQKREQVERMMARCARSYLQELISAKGKLPRIPYEDLDIALNFCTYGIVGLLLECCDKKKAVDRETMARQMYRLLQGRIGEADPVRA